MGNIDWNTIIPSILSISGIGAALAALWAKLKPAIKKFESVEDIYRNFGTVVEACKTLSKNSLYKRCKEAIKTGERDLHITELVDELYASYHALGGNGRGTDLYEQFRKLPLKVD